MFGRAIYDKLPESIFENYQKIFKNHEDDLSKNCPNQICDYWLITHNQQTVCIEINTFKQQVTTNQRADNYKITPLTVP